MLRARSASGTVGERHAYRRRGCAGFAETSVPDRGEESGRCGSSGR